MGPPSHIRKGDFMKYVLGAKCVKCGREYPAAPGLTTCACGGILDIVYDYAAIRRHFFPKSLADCRDYSMWRYRAPSAGGGGVRPPAPAGGLVPSL